MADNALVPELAVRDAARSLAFYRDTLGFSVVYQRLDEGFAFLRLGGAQLMIDQIGVGRTFTRDDAPLEYPLGRGVNLQIRAPDLDALLKTLDAALVTLYLPVEENGIGTATSNSASASSSWPTPMAICCVSSRRSVRAQRRRSFREPPIHPLRQPRAWPEGPSERPMRSGSTRCGGW